MSKVEIQCFNCGKRVWREAGEFNRSVRLGRRSFCSSRCACAVKNCENPSQCFPIEKTCPVCGRQFMTRTGPHEKTYCDRTCGSRGPWAKESRGRRVKKLQCLGRVQGKKNLRHDPKTIAAALLSREKWKYQRLEDYLSGKEEPHTFEFPLGRHIFDLALLDQKLLIEFDEQYHSGKKQKAADARKDRYAEKRGWHVVRVEATRGVLSPNLIKAVL